MLAGLSTPLHLAASLLALFAALGFGLVVLGQQGGPRGRLAPWIVAVGAFAIAAAHGLAGALVEPTAEPAGWLRAGGLVLIAAGLTRRSLAVPQAGVLIPATVLPVAVVGAAAAALAGLRAVLAGRQALPAAVGLMAWAAAEALTQVSATAAAVATTIGALALGVWVWQATAPRLLARFVAAFVVSLVAVVVLIAGVLSGVGATRLVDEELRRLSDFSGRLSDEVGREWPDLAILAAQPLRAAPETIARIDREDRAGLARIYRLALSQQDFVVLLEPDGRVRNHYSPDADLVTGSFLFQLTGTPAVDSLIAGATREGGVFTSGGTIVAFGGVQLERPGAAPEEPPLGLLITGRQVDEVWVAQTGRELGVELFVEVGGALGVTSPGLPRPVEVADRLDPGTVRAGVVLDDRVVYAAAAPVRDPATQEHLGRIVAASTGDVLAQLERDQARQLFLLALVGAALAGAVAGVLSGRLVAPIRRLTSAAAAVREGKLDVDADVGTPDEVGELGRTFNEMTASLSAQSSQLREAAAVQARLRARLEALTASMSDALVATDDAGAVITFNPAAERLTGYPVDQAVGHRLDEILVGHGPDGTTPVEAVGAPTSEETVAVQLLLGGADGRYVPTAVTAAPVHDPAGRVLGRVLVLRDVTRETEVERMKTEFLSNVSHELRTPLTPIKGYAEVLFRRDVGPDATREFAGQILDATVRLERIVSLIVEFAALDSGKMQPRREPTLLGPVVGQVLSGWRERRPDRDFRRRIARDVPAVFVDPDMLRRCLDELIDNAVKFSPGGEPVSVTAAPAGPGGRNGRGMVRLSVRDQGVGMEPEMAAQVFADFYQADASETRHFGGLGLGLALVRRIIDGLDGDASIEAAPGEGATVHLLLPAADVPRARRSVAGRIQAGRR